MTRLEAAVAANQQQRRILLDGSTRDQSGLTDGLDPFGNTRIMVYLTKPGLIREVSCNPKAIGTVMRDSTGYLIFVDRQSDPELQSLWGDFTHRFVVLHEYAHIIRGDVFEDKDDGEKAKISALAPEALSKYWGACDDFANRYAAARLRLELAGDT